MTRPTRPTRLTRLTRPTRPGPVAEAMAPPATGERRELSSAGEAAATSWRLARQRLAEAETYWLATVRPDGRSHVVPVLAVWVDSTLYLCASDTTRKAKNLAHNPHCVITTHTQGADLVVEGQATTVDAPGTAQRVAEAYGSKYGWHPEVRDGGLWADGAPTAGPPPYRVYAVTPTTAFGFPNDEEPLLNPTRWRF